MTNQIDYSKNFLDTSMETQIGSPAFDIASDMEYLSLSQRNIQPSYIGSFDSMNSDQEISCKQPSKPQFYQVNNNQEIASPSFYSESCYAMNSEIPCKQPPNSHSGSLYSNLDFITSLDDDFFIKDDNEEDDDDDVDVDGDGIKSIQDQPKNLENYSELARLSYQNAQRNYNQVCKKWGPIVNYNIWNFLKSNFESLNNRFNMLSEDSLEFSLIEKNNNFDYKNDKCSALIMWECYDWEEVVIKIKRLKTQLDRYWIWRS